MKKSILIAFAFIGNILNAQTYNSPESVEFDYVNNRWFIANNGGDNILVRNSVTGALSVFVPTGFSGGGPHGLEIVGDTLYACSGASIRAYNINTAALVFATNLGATFLNGITHDNSGNLYITDYSGNKIYRFNTNTRQYNVFVSTGLSSPNGIIYDQPNNRCVFVQWTGAIKSVSLSDSTVTTLVASSGLSSVDGITKDGIGNYYVSSWSPQRITRYTNTFTSPTAVVTTGLSNPADIFYNVVTDTLGVPNSGTGNNTKYYYFGSATGVNESFNSCSPLSVFPSMIQTTAEIKFELNSDNMVLLEIIDVNGKRLEILTNQKYASGTHSIKFDLSSYSSGVYFIKMTYADQEVKQKIVVVK